MDAYTPVKGKCMWWRETLDEEERHDTRVKREDVKVLCTCFVEGHFWTYRQAEMPADCPQCRHCRYYIRHG